MSERNIHLDKMSAKGANYGQCVLGFGLPFIIIYQAIDYAIFSIIGVGIPYAWRIKVAMDIPYMLFVSALWWGLRRRPAIWKQKIQQK